MRLLDGWSGVERDGVDRFRRMEAAGTAQFVICGALQTLLIDAAPGVPATVASEVSVALGDGFSRSYVISDRETLRFVVPPRNVGIESLRIATTSRDLRVFRLAIARRPREVVPVWDGFDVGRGWYMPEFSRGEIYRWATWRVEIIVKERRPSLTVDLEPGTSSLRSPLALDIDIGGATQRLRLERRRMITIPIAAESELPCRIVISAAARPEPPLGLGAVGVFRAYAAYADWESATPARLAAKRRSEAHDPDGAALAHPVGFFPFSG
jgi:hypothetical protein